MREGKAIRRLEPTLNALFSLRHCRANLSPHPLPPSSPIHLVSAFPPPSQPFHHFFFLCPLHSLLLFFFFLNDPAPPEISPFPLPAPFPIKGSSPRPFSSANAPAGSTSLPLAALTSMPVSVGTPVAKVPAKASRSSRRRMRPRRPPLCS